MLITMRFWRPCWFCYSRDMCWGIGVWEWKCVLFFLCARVCIVVGSCVVQCLRLLACVVLLYLMIHLDKIINKNHSTMRFVPEWELSHCVVGVCVKMKQTQTVWLQPLICSNGRIKLSHSRSCFMKLFIILISYFTKWTQQKYHSYYPLNQSKGHLNLKLKQLFTLLFLFFPFFYKWGNKPFL